MPKKQPYIPLYTGDYLKDTRTLTLAAKGAWMDLIIFMWSAETRGILIGRNSDFARMVGATPEEFAAVLLELCLKRICDKTELGGGQIQLVCRRMIRDAEISAKKALSGSKGGSKTQANNQAKLKQNTDNDIAIDNDIEEELKVSLDERYISEQRMKWNHLDFDFQLSAFHEKVRGSPSHYADHGTAGIRLAFQKQLREAKPKSKFNGTGGNKKQQHVDGLVTDHARRWGDSAAEGKAV